MVQVSVYNMSNMLWLNDAKVYFPGAENAMQCAFLRFGSIQANARERAIFPAALISSLWPTTPGAIIGTINV